MAKKKVRRARPIVIGHLERISRGIFDQYKKQITGLIKENQGIYALYRKEKLYYVGLAKDLRRRLDHHLRDRHRGKWTHFSLYVLRRGEHLREVEALLLRIADPTGNYTKGKLKGSTNLWHELKTLLTEDFQESMVKLLGIRRTSSLPKKRKAVVRKGNVTKRETGDRPLKGVFKTGKMIYATYKGKDYKAWVNRIGRIRYEGKWYDSPSAVGSVIRGGKSTNGWLFWKYKDKSGRLVPLNTLRK